MDEKADDSVEEPQPFVDLFGVVDENDENLVKNEDPVASTMNPNYRDDRKLFQRWRTDLSGIQICRMINHTCVYTYIYIHYIHFLIYTYINTHTHIYKHIHK